MTNNRRDEFNRWFSQAKYDLSAARDSADAGNFEWAAFQAQQAAEKALKSFLYLRGKVPPFTHSVAVLLKECAKLEADFGGLKGGKELDKYYVPTRYPNGLPDGVPHEFFDAEDAKKCLRDAKEIVDLIRKLSGR